MRIIWIDALVYWNSLEEPIQSSKVMFRVPCWYRRQTIFLKYTCCIAASPVFLLSLYIPSDSYKNIHFSIICTKNVGIRQDFLAVSGLNSTFHSLRSSVYLANIAPKICSNPTWVLSGLVSILNLLLLPIYFKTRFYHVQN